MSLAPVRVVVPVVPPLPVLGSFPQWEVPVPMGLTTVPVHQLFLQLTSTTGVKHLKQLVLVDGGQYTSPWILL